MSDFEKIVTYIFVWHCLSDACEKCRALNGREWREQSIFQNTLWDMFFGDIWDLNVDHSLAHPNCRCQLEVRVETDWSEWKELIDINEFLREIL